ncbi:MAG: PepSY domain-containing protein [Kineosporiaceae bacterium]|nr:PepSY domain-containing protein [Kineosporiaceae bacterium]
MTTTSATPPPEAPSAAADEPSVLEGSPDTRVGTSSSGSTGWFRALWRWHFYASFLVIPVMFLLSVTGLTILYKWQLDPLFHPGVLTVDVPSQGAARPLSDQEAAVRAAHPNATITAVQQGADNRATFFTVSLGEQAGERNVYVDQYTGAITGEVDPADLPSNLATEIHGQIVFGDLSSASLGTDPLVASGLTRTPWSQDELTLGKLGDGIIELGACWAIIMAITGYYLFLRGRAARLRRLAKAATTGAGARIARVRNDHARFGAMLGVGFLLLVASGLPWTGVWGNVVQNLATGRGSSLWGEDPGATSTLGSALVEAGSNANPAPWAEGAAPLPRSGEVTGGVHAGHSHGTDASGSAGSVNIDQVVTAALSDGMPQPYYVLYPGDETGVFSVLADQWHDKAAPAFTDTSKERTVHVDQYSGQIIGRYSYEDYSAAARAVSQGIALHEGRRLGTFNLVTTTAFCLGVIFLCISGPVMWWKRRPAGSGIGAPRGALPIRRTWWLPVILVILGVVFPLFGLSLLVVLGVDLGMRRLSARRGQVAT